MKKLGDIAIVSSGHTFRSRIDEDRNGNYSVIQIKDFDEDDQIVFEGLLKTQIESVNSKFLAKSGDILFRSRGTSTRASLVNDLSGENYVVASPLLIVRIDTHQFLSEYVQLVINHSASQRYFSRAAQGSFVRMIDKETLENLMIPSKSIADQKNVIELSRLIQTEKSLMSQIASKRQILLEGVFEIERE